MTAKLGVLIIHGMGKQQSDFADPLIRRLRRRLGPQAEDLVAFKACYWADILQAYQNRNWRNLVMDSHMEAQRLRDFFVSWLGDAVSYTVGYYKPSQHGYCEVHERICASLTELENEVETDAPLMVLAHSLGSVIMNNYIWDEQHPTSRKEVEPRTAFQRAETLSTFITYGSNIPLFLPPQEKIECITFPSPNLDEKYQAIAKWINIYDTDDVLGYPLKNIWTDTHGTLIQDMEVNIGLPLISETFFSHAFYDSDNDFLNIVHDQIQVNLAVSGIVA